MTALPTIRAHRPTIYLFLNNKTNSPGRAYALTNSGRVLLSEHVRNESEVESALSPRNENAVLYAMAFNGGPYDIEFVPFAKLHEHDGLKAALNMSLVTGSAIIIFSDMVVQWARTVTFPEFDTLSFIESSMQEYCGLDIRCSAPSPSRVTIAVGGKAVASLTVDVKGSRNGRLGTKGNPALPSGGTTLIG